MPKILFAWIGQADLDASRGESRAGIGPIARAVTDLQFDLIVLLNNYPKKAAEGYLAWLNNKTSTEVRLREEQLSSPMHFGQIYEAATSSVSDVLRGLKDGSLTIRERNRGPLSRNELIDLTFHISPGTSAMAAVWVILSKTRFPATLIQSSEQRGVEIASVPFDISAEFIPDLLLRPDRKLESLTAGLPPEAPEFRDMIHRSSVMKQVISKARRVAPRSVPVLIEGESGTGKELLARAIHRASPRHDKPFVAVNCGAIPNELVESELFGHEKGAFSGADRQRKGHFEEANGGTLFLDEIGELPLQAQVKLLRVLQEKEVSRLGSSHAHDIDVRILAATNRNLAEETASGRFREDLFYRLAVAVLKLPPIRQRPGDVSLLIDHLLGQINEESKEEPGYKDKTISPGAKNLLLRQAWPGNVREIYNTIRRAAIWSQAATINEEDIKEALLPSIGSRDSEILNRPLGHGLNLKGIIDLVVRHYLERAIREAHGSKTKAAELLGLPNYQTLTNWMKRYGIES